ncbi:MAG: 2-C-methyl-D-erythritol 4-phosphate cytidylyltransferase [Oscillospiraceae bacterium]
MFCSHTKNKKQDAISCSAVVVAAGSSLRFGSNKLFAMLSSAPVLAYSLLTLQACDYINEIVVVADTSGITAAAELCEAYHIDKATKIVCGGETRVESALSGISEINPNAKLVAIHDGARPLVTKPLIERVIECAFKYKAAVPAVSTKDTVKIVSKGIVSETPDRPRVYGIQTPQVFQPEIIKGALTNALQNHLNVFDDASAVEALGFPVYITDGSEENIKITTPLDLKLCEAILNMRKEIGSASGSAAK